MLAIRQFAAVYIESLAAGAGLWTGNDNQRVINIRASRESGRIVLYS